MIGRYERSRPDQGDVGTVKSRDEGQSLTARSGGQHLAREQRAHRVRYRIVHVQQVEIVELGDFSHARGQRQIVRRIVEQRITGDFYFVIVDVRVRRRAGESAARTK